MDEYLFISRDISTLNITNIFKKYWDKDPELFIKFIMFIRDYKNGRGEKDIAINLFNQLKKTNLLIYKMNMDIFYGKYGCYKDILKIEDNYLELEFLKNQLENDLDNMKQDKAISLAAKWAPSEKSKYHNYAKILANLLFPRMKNNLSLYRKNILIPLRNYLNIIETKMCNQQWIEINNNFNNNINIIPYKASKLYKKAFNKHISNFNYQKDKKDSIYDLINYYLINNKYDQDIENKIKIYISNIKNKSYFLKTLPIINLTNINKYVLSIILIISECNITFQNKIINSTNIIDITSNNYYEKINKLKNIQWKKNDDINDIYKKLLNIIHPYKNKIDRYILFTDNDFILPDMKINKLIYNMSGNHLPKLLYWNIEEKDSINNISEDIVLVSGFSKLITKYLLDHDFSIINLLANYEVKLHQ